MTAHSPIPHDGNLPPTGGHTAVELTRVLDLLGSIGAQLVWVIADTPAGFAPISQRLRHSTDWDPTRTIGFAHVGDDELVRLAARAVQGMRGATRTGALWHIHHGRLIHHTPTRRSAMTDTLIPRPAVEITPGAVHVPDYLTIAEQKKLVDACREWARGPVPIRHTTLPHGGVMSVQTVCLCECEGVAVAVDTRGCWGSVTDRRGDRLSRDRPSPRVWRADAKVGHVEGRRRRRHCRKTSSNLPDQRRPNSVE